MAHEQLYAFDRLLAMKADSLYCGVERGPNESAQDVAIETDDEDEDEVQHSSEDAVEHVSSFNRPERFAVPIFV